MKAPGADAGVAWRPARGRLAIEWHQREQDYRGARRKMTAYTDIVGASYSSGQLLVCLFRVTTGPRRCRGPQIALGGLLWVVLNQFEHSTRIAGGWSFAS